MPPVRDVLYLDCPYEQKDDADALGATFDVAVQKWCIPTSTPNLEVFQRWRPHRRVYLQHGAEAMGAKWDAIVEQWYVRVKPGANVPRKFVPFILASEDSSSSDQGIFPDTSTSLSSSQVAVIAPPRVVSSSSSAAATGNNKKKATNNNKSKASSSSLSSSTSIKKDDRPQSRISDALTIAQLQEECKVRGVKGYSGRNKDWLLQELGVGTLWLSAGGNGKTSIKVEGSAAAVATAASKKTPTSSSSSLRITESLTIAQLREECQWRGISGYSHQNKEWLLDELGVGTTWLSAAAATKSTTQPSSAAQKTIVRISETMTTVQLQDECKWRGIAGYSNQNKDWLLRRLGVGTTWLSATTTSGGTTPTTAKKNNKTAIRISETMTTAQLQEECKLRGVKGYSGQNKDWLLEELGVGTLWLAVNQQSQKNPPSKEKKQQQQVSGATKKHNSTAATPTVCISETMTVGQLQAECQYRGIKGYSSQTKDWLLEELGVGTRWLSHNNNSNMTKNVSQQTTTASLRISDTMTVGQLQDECRFRGVKGFSGQTKDWLLEQLRVGTRWLGLAKAGHQHDGKPAASTSPNGKSGGGTDATTASNKNNKKQHAPTAPPSKKASESNNNKKTKSSVSTSSSVQLQMTMTLGASSSSFSLSCSSSTSTTKKSVSGGATKRKKQGSSSISSIDWALLPCVSSDLTVAQLGHELLHRQPSLKGTSNKPKSWFLEKLGEHSIWSTSSQTLQQCPRLMKNQHPCVTSSLTSAQLTHEIMTRRSIHGDSDAKTVGLSRKTKPELLQLAGEGSLWTTAPLLLVEEMAAATTNSSNKKQKR